MQRRELEVLSEDGRRVLAEVAGPEDGGLVVFHTGTPGTRRLYLDHVGECADRGLRLVCISRPGYDGSDRLPGRSYADGPADTAAVADALGAEGLYVIGQSGGGGPALADAALLPGRVRAVASVAALAPRSAPGLDWWAGTELANGEEFAAVLAGDAALEAFVTRLAAQMRQVESGDQIREGFMSLFSQVDLDVLAGSLLEYQVECYPLVVRGGTWGWFDDDKALLGDWGFDLAQITVPVSIWQGGRDNIIPAPHGRWLADNIPGAKLHLLPDEGHISLTCRHYGAILDDLIARGG